MGRIGIGIEKRKNKKGSELTAMPRLEDDSTDAHLPSGVGLGNVAFDTRPDVSPRLNT